mgnify:CR=1 FL=1
MSEYEIRSVGGHVEVYTRGGVFLFSADTVREAMEELDEAARRVPGSSRKRARSARGKFKCKIPVKYKKRTVYETADQRGNAVKMQKTCKITLVVRGSSML